MDNQFGSIILRATMAAPTLAVGVAGVVLAWTLRRRSPRGAALFAAGAVLTTGWVVIEFAAYDWPNLSLQIDELAGTWSAAFSLFWGVEQAVHTVSLLLFAGAFLTDRK